MAKRLFTLKEWEGAGCWYVACTDDLAHNSGAWYMPARAANIPLVDFILTLKNDYHADVHFHGDTNFVYYSFKEYKDAHRFLLDFNKKARQNKFMI